MAVTHDWECMAHGVFQARGSAQKPPKCPKGCSASLVTLVFLHPPAFGSARVRTADRLLREAATIQGLSDISTSPSRPGGSVAQRNAARMRGPKGREYPEYLAALSTEIGKNFSAGSVPTNENTLSQLGFGHSYNAKEWVKDKESGKSRHVGAGGPIQTKPLGSTGVSIERVKERR